MASEGPYDNTPRVVEWARVPKNCDGDVLRLSYAFSEEGSINMNFRAGACDIWAQCGNDPGRAHIVGEALSDCRVVRD